MGANKTITLMGQIIEVNTSDKDPMESNINQIINCNLPKLRRPYTKTIVKSNNFPKDVKTLMATNIFNGIPVKYISWSRKEKLKGLIHGTGYVCSCKSCNGYKIVKSGLEFEAHAGCMTKHSNHHIYFPNGKSLYEVVRILQDSPPENMCEAIQELMEGHVNQFNFRKWKAKYEEACKA